MLGVVLSSFLGNMSHLTLVSYRARQAQGDTHFTHEEAEAQRVSDLSGVPQLTNDRAGIEPGLSKSKPRALCSIPQLLSALDFVLHSDSDDSTVHHVH